MRIYAFLLGGFELLSRVVDEERYSHRGVA